MFAHEAGFIDWFFPIVNTLLLIGIAIIGLWLFLWQNKQFEKRAKMLQDRFEERLEQAQARAERTLSEVKKENHV